MRTANGTRVVTINECQRAFNRESDRLIALLRSGQITHDEYEERLAEISETLASQLEELRK